MRTATTPTGIVTANVYDANFRKTSTTLAYGTAQAATTQFQYDANGNQTAVIDPRDLATTTAYDNRDRKSSSTDPLSQITRWDYDAVGNVLTLTQPDNTTKVKTYDAMNRILTEKDEMDRITVYTYSPSGMLETVLDPKQQPTHFEYNERDLKSKMTYPDGAVVQSWKYDDAGNLIERPTVGGPRQLFRYDQRNRKIQMRWDNAIDFSDFSYDDANRLTLARNPYSTVTRGYDDAGRLTLDRQALAGIQNSPALTVQPTKIVSRQTHGAAGGLRHRPAADWPSRD